jgi:hypothetical protein
LVTQIKITDKSEAIQALFNSENQRAQALKITEIWVKKTTDQSGDKYECK